MKLINEKGKIFGVLNIIDLIVVVAVVAVAVLGVLYMRGGGLKSGDDVWVYYTVEVEGQYKGFHDVIEVGGAVRDIQRNYDMGVVESYRVRDSYSWQLNEDTREYFKFTYENEEVVELTVKAAAKATDAGVSLVSGGGAVRVGKKMYIEGKGYGAVGYCVDLRTEARK